MLATCVIQPIDMVKVRLQLGASGSPVKTLSYVQVTCINADDIMKLQHIFCPSLPD